MRMLFNKGVSMYECINGYTKESMINKIYEGNNGERAHDGTACCYLTQNGNKCAVGCFIPDGHRGQSFRGDVLKLLRGCPDLEEFMPLNQYGLLSLQGVHDITSIADPRPLLIEWINENVI